jgi:uncharacterized protein YaiL (DUF2058 family)
MNSIGHKMNNKLTNTIGHKMNNKINAMGHKMMPLFSQPFPLMSNLINEHQSNKLYDTASIKNIIDRKINRRNRLTK